MRSYAWEPQLHELQSTDLVAFRSWLLKEYKEAGSESGGFLRFLEDTILWQIMQKM
jgi:hypothetical protein